MDTLQAKLIRGIYDLTKLCFSVGRFIKLALAISEVCLQMHGIHVNLVCIKIS
jgi:hypothetical protein